MRRPTGNSGAELGAGLVPSPKRRAVALQEGRIGHLPALSSPLAVFSTAPNRAPAALSTGRGIPWPADPLRNELGEIGGAGWRFVPDRRQDRSASCLRSWSARIAESGLPLQRSAG
jgi:hypothetical protein